MEYYRLTIPVPKRPWLWIRYRLVSILLLAAVIAVALAWRRDHQRLAAQIDRFQNPSSGYGANEATGAPNTTGARDSPTAWASASQDDQAEWLVLEFAEKIVPKAIRIHENLNPGAVVKVTHYPKWGKERVLWEGADPTPVTAASGVSRLPIAAATKTGRIKIYIDSPAVPGWNEIDAVGLEDEKGNVLWAERASASSTYGNRDLPENFSGFVLQR